MTTVLSTPASLGDSTAPAVDLGPAVALSCRECGHRIALGPFYACTECFGPLEVAYEFALTGEALREAIEAGPTNIWRYAPLLPVPSGIAQTRNMNPGGTKLVRADNLARELGMKTLWVKDDSGNPTHSFKDRVVAVALAAARELGF
jgi:threonine synthase